MQVHLTRNLIYATFKKTEKSMLTLDFSKQVVLIAGGSRGIGQAAARLFARAGADVAILYSHNHPAARRLSSEIASLHRNFISFQVNIENFSDCRSAIRKIQRKFGRIDHLINSAGIWNYAPFSKMSPAQWKQTLDINLNGIFNTCRLVAPTMKKQGGGCIVNVSSTAGQRGEANYSHYATSKGGIIAMTKSLAAEFARDGIRVNCVAPGWVDTDMISHVLTNSSKKREILRSIPRGKIATPDDIAAPILFLCSEMANHIIGEVLNINGGSVLCG